MFDAVSHVWRWGLGSQASLSETQSLDTCAKTQERGHPKLSPCQTLIGKTVFSTHIGGKSGKRKERIWKGSICTLFVKYERHLTVTLSPRLPLEDAYTLWSWISWPTETWFLQERGGGCSPFCHGDPTPYIWRVPSPVREAWGELFLHMLRLSVKQEVTENSGLIRSGKAEIRGTRGCSDLLREGCTERGPAWPDLPWEMGGAPKQLRAPSQDSVCFLMAKQPSLQTQEGRSRTALRGHGGWPSSNAGPLFPFSFLLFTLPLSLWRWWLTASHYLEWMPGVRSSTPTIELSTGGWGGMRGNPALCLQGKSSQTSQG